MPVTRAAAARALAEQIAEGMQHHFDAEVAHMQPTHPGFASNPTGQPASMIGTQDRDGEEPALPEPRQSACNQVRADSSMNSISDAGIVVPTASHAGSDASDPRSLRGHLHGDIYEEHEIGSALRSLGDQQGVSALRSLGDRQGVSAPPFPGDLHEAADITTIRALLRGANKASRVPPDQADGTPPVPSPWSWPPKPAAEQPAPSPCSPERPTAPTSGSHELRDAEHADPDAAYPKCGVTNERDSGHDFFPWLRGGGASAPTLSGRGDVLGVGWYCP
jgi:hypothetical protein